MAPIPVAPAVYPVAGHIAMACGRWDCKDDDKRTKDNLRFYQKNVDCDNKGVLLIKYRIGFVLSETEIDCGWEKLYSEDNISIYGFD